MAAEAQTESVEEPGGKRLLVGSRRDKENGPGGMFHISIYFACPSVKQVFAKERLH